MTTRALCGGAHACRNRPSLSLDPRLRTGVSLLNFNLATTSKPLFSGWASLHVLRNVPQRRQAMTSNEAAHCQARHWTADRVRRTRLYSNATSTSHSRVAIWSGTGPRRCFSRTTQYFQERNKTYDKDRYVVLVCITLISACGLAHLSKRLTSTEKRFCNAI